MKKGPGALADDLVQGTSRIGDITRVNISGPQYRHIQVVRPAVSLFNFIIVIIVRSLGKSTCDKRQDDVFGQ